MSTQNKAFGFFLHPTCLSSRWTPLTEAWHSQAQGPELDASGTDITTSHSGSSRRRLRHHLAIMMAIIVILMLIPVLISRRSSLRALLKLFAPLQSHTLTGENPKASIPALTRERDLRLCGVESTNHNSLGFLFYIDI